MVASSDIDSLPRQREIQIEGCALAGLALHPNLARMLLNDAVGHRQAQAGALALAFSRRGLGGEERIVDALDVFLRNAGAGVGDAPRSRRRRSRWPLAAFRLRAWRPGVQEQVQEHLLQASRIAADQRQVAGQFVLNPDLGDLELVLQQRQRVAR